MLTRLGLPPLAGLRYHGWSVGAFEVEGDRGLSLRAVQVELDVQVGIEAEANVARRAAGMSREYALTPGHAHQEDHHVYVPVSKTFFCWAGHDLY